MGELLCRSCAAGPIEMTMMNSDRGAGPAVSASVPMGIIAVRCSGFQAG